jgi:hypothetical protein
VFFVGKFFISGNAAWLRVASETAHKTPADIISDMVREKMTAALYME